MFIFHLSLHHTISCLSATLFSVLTVSYNSSLAFHTTISYSVCYIFLFSCFSFSITPSLLIFLPATFPSYLSVPLSHTVHHAISLTFHVFFHTLTSQSRHLPVYSSVSPAFFIFLPANYFSLFSLCNISIFSSFRSSLLVSASPSLSTALPVPPVSSSSQTHVSLWLACVKMPLSVNENVCL